MASDSDVLNIVEIPNERGSLRFRYRRYLSPDGKQWIRHGLFHAYHPNGQLASEGEYEDGSENGPWTFATLQDIVRNAKKQQGDIDVPGLLRALLHYYENDAFIRLK